MGEATLTVPAAQVERFRLAAMQEVEWDAGWVESTVREAANSILWDKPDKDRMVDVHGSVRGLSGAVAVVEQLEAAVSGEAMDVKAESSVLANIAEGMVRHGVAEKFTEVAEVGPFDSEIAEEMRELVEALTWATENAVELHARAVAEFKATEPARHAVAA